MFVEADIKRNKPLMKCTEPDDTTGPVLETSDLRMTFQTVTFCFERLSSKPLESGLISGTKQRGDDEGWGGRGEREQTRDK